MQKYLLYIICLFILTNLQSQNTGLPFNPGTIDDDGNLKYIDWTSNTLESIPLNTGGTFVTGVGFNQNEEIQFFVVQLDGTNDGPSLHISNTNGEILSSEPMVGLFRELQVLPVPEAENEWYIIYGGEPGEIVFSSSAAYTPNKLRYARIFYDGTTFNFIEKDVVLTVNGTTYTYSDGRAVSFNPSETTEGCSFAFYAGRRTQNQASFSIDRFIIDNSGITWEANTGDVSLPYWGWGIAASHIEVSHQGDKIAYCNRNTQDNASDILIFDATDFSTTSLQIINLDELVLQPDFDLLNTPTPIGVLANTNSNFSLYDQFSYKFQTIEFSPLGNYLYVGGGGNQVTGSAFRSYIAQIDLTTTYPYDIRVQTQATSMNHVQAIESFYDGNLYFTKSNNPILYSIPNADMPMPQTLGEGDIDMSTAEVPNITYDFGDNVLLLLDPIDGYDYKQQCATTEIVSGCTDSLALNYDATATEDDGSCIYEEIVSGCTDSLALNYDVAATEDDGSCIYCEANAGTLQTDTVPFYCGNNNVSITVSSIDFLAQNEYTQVYLLTNETLTIQATNANGSFPNLTEGTFIVHALNILSDELPTSLIGLNAIEALQNANCYDLISSDSFTILKPIEIATNYDCNTETGVYTLTFSISGGMPEYATTSGVGEAADFFYTASGDLSGNYTFGENTTIEYTDNTPYTITANDSKSCTATISDSPSPCTKTAIELLSFTGRVLEQSNKITWATATETDNDFFTLEATTNGVDFTEIAKIKGAINSTNTQNYQYNDKNPKTENYYRLKATDTNGKTEIVSNVIHLQRNNKLDLNITPNPANDHITATFTTEKETTINLSICDINGRELQTRTLQTKKGKNTITLNISTYPNGTYILKYNNEAQTKFIKTQ